MSSTRELRWLITHRVEDDDGEFLLIEAAHHLPEWLDEHNAGGRVRST